MRRMHRYRGSTMGLYAMFIVFVGIPLLAATVDMTRYWVKRAELTNAVEAACSAYANTPDIAAYRDRNVFRLGNEARGEGIRFFGYNMPEGGELTGLDFTITNRYEDTGVVIAFCSGRASIRPIVLIGTVSYDMTYSTTVKAKFGTSTNWR